jgi:hypothetical protein
MHLSAVVSVKALIVLVISLGWMDAQSTSLAETELQ